MNLHFINFNKIYSLAISEDCYIVGEVDFENSRNGNIKVLYPVLIRNIFAFDLSENKPNGFTNIRKLNMYGKDNFTFVNSNNILSMEKANLLCKLNYFKFFSKDKQNENIFIKRTDLSEEELESICIRKKENIINKLNKLLRLN